MAGSSFRTGPWDFGRFQGPYFYRRGSSETPASGRQVEILGAPAFRRYDYTLKKAWRVLARRHAWPENTGIFQDLPEIPWPVL